MGSTGCRVTVTDMGKSDKSLESPMDLKIVLLFLKVGGLADSGVTWAVF